MKQKQHSPEEIIRILRQAKTDETMDRLTYFGPLRVRLSGWLKSLWGLGIPAGYGVFSRCNAAANPQLRPVLCAGSITTPDLDIRHENDYENFQYSRSAKGYLDQYRVF